MRIVLYSLPIFIISILSAPYDTLSADTRPIKRWQTSIPEEQGMHSYALADMMEHIKLKSYHIDSILIVRNGRLVLDAYFWPFSKGEKHNIQSCTKSIMSALIGIAIDKGYIQTVHQPIMDFFPQKVTAGLDTQKKTITLQHLLFMAAGLKCMDSFLYLWAGLREMQFSSIWAQHLLELPVSVPPGEKFEYCNGISYLLSAIIQNTTGMDTLAFAGKHLFEPLCINDIEWETSPQGVKIGWGEMRLTPHDMAKFGWLYLNEGRWGKKQILSSQWVKDSTRGHMDTQIFNHYGYQWWVDSAGYYMAVGFKGQRIFVVPNKNLVAVFTGDLTGLDSYVPKTLLDYYIIPAASSNEALPQKNDDQLRLIYCAEAELTKGGFYYGFITILLVDDYF